MFEYNNQWFVLGNRTLNNLNLSLNGIGDDGVKYIFDAVAEQEHTAENAPEGLVGLFRLNLRVWNRLERDTLPNLTFLSLVQSDLERQSLLPQARGSLDQQKSVP